MIEKEYRQLEGISRSELWRLRESPEKFKYYQEHPEEPTPALIFGAAVHKILLDPDGFDDEYAVAPECDRRTKDGREAYNAFPAAAEGKDVISQADYDTALLMAKIVRETAFVGKLLAGEKEKPFIWTDELTGEVCKVRVDAITEVNGRPVIVDYKTTNDASTESFMRTAVNYGYDFQAGMYCEGVAKATGQKPIFVFIAQEKTAPYAVNILQADDVMIQRGYDLFRELLGIYHQCIESGNWYGYLGAYNVINNLTLPAWLVDKE